jgi:two-component system sensor histidine kinase BaeS
MAERPARASLAVRLAAAFVGVAVLAVATLALVMLVTTRSETRRISDHDRSAAAAQTAAALARAYAAAGSWSTTDVSQAVARAQRAQAVLVVRDAQGAVLYGAGRGRGAGLRAGSHPSRVSAAVRVADRTVGTVELRFPTGLGAAEQQLRDKLAGAVLLGSAIAVAIALLAAGLVGRRLTAPLRRLTTAARRLRSGDLGARAGDARAPGELGDLADAFDGMATSLEREDEARRRLVSDLSHEVRTPLTILRGNLEELLDGSEPPTPARLGSLHEEVLRLESLVEQLDTLRQAGAPLLAIDGATFDLAELTAAELEAFGPRFAAKRLHVHANLAAARLRGDRAKLGQVIANLLSNALKFVPEGGRVDVAVGPRDGTVELDVSDDGPGIPADERERVFDRFWRGTASAGIAGRGIGLAVVDDIVTAHGGSIRVSGGRQGGARFTVTLPGD